MTARDAALALLASVIWGCGFVAGVVALQSFTPAQLTALRFLLAGSLAVVVPRPPIPWPSIVAIGATLFTGQFLLVFFAFAHGLPPGVAAVSQQRQAFFTVLLAAVVLRDVPGPRHCIAMLMALAGLSVIASTRGGDVTLTGLALGLAAALSWAVGNVLVKRTPDAPIVPLVVWCSLVPPLPALAVSLVTDEHESLVETLRAASWQSLVAVIYLAGPATITAYAAWGHLLQRCSTAALAPFALLAPCVGVVASAIAFGEVPGAARLAGMVLILGGLAVVLVSPVAWTTPQPPSGR